MLALEVRVARLQGWTLAESMRQPYGDLLLIAADHILESEHHTQGMQHPAGAPSSARPRTRRTSKTIEYRLKPKSE